ncbi:GIY-YIG nuclease family protein [Synechococcus sp. CS-1332]|uniref:GIY-YIG nuclease family protein n=1 Tax=Synechococcus sp. CS-1332 TaxID=2847972 RepID=UPI00223BA131|nr:GIY-YIG nuclease family protein [Synechococcus sp. CS-1332]
MSALPAVLTKRYLAIVENPPDWLRAGGKASLFVPSVEEISGIAIEFQGIKSGLNELRNDWMPSERRIELNILLQLSLAEFMTRPIAMSLEQDFIDASLDSEFMNCTYLKYLSEEQKNSHEGEVGPWDDNLSDRADERLTAFKEHFAALDFLLQSLYWNTFELDGIGFGEQVWALDFWRKSVRGKVEDANNELLLANKKTKPSLREWLELGLQEMGYHGESPDSFPEIKKAWNSGQSQDLPARLRTQYLDFFVREYEVCSTRNRSLRQKYMHPEDHERWDQWQRSYFQNRLVREEYVSNLLEALRMLEESSGPPNDHPHTGAHGFVYLVRNGDLFKIGVTQNLLSRMSQLRPDEVLNVARCANYREIERVLHSEFKAVRIPQSEYFRLSLEQVEHVHRLLTDQAKYS